MGGLGLFEIEFFRAERSLKSVYGLRYCAVLLLLGNAIARGYESAAPSDL